MKKILYAICSLSLFAALFTSCKDEKEQMKESVTKECIESGDKQFTDPKMRSFFHEYCSCTGEKTSEKMSKAEWREFEKMKAQGKDAEMQAKLMPIIQPCLDELQKKIAQQMK